MTTTHYHCPAPGCYWRIQFIDTCSRCGGPTVQQEGCCGPQRNDPRKLSDNEIITLAYRLAERQLATDWLEWEDIPGIGQWDFDLLIAKVGTVRNYLHEARRLMETRNIDSSALLEEFDG